MAKLKKLEPNKVVEEAVVIRNRSSKLKRRSKNRLRLLEDRRRKLTVRRLKMRLEPFRSQRPTPLRRWKLSMPSPRSLKPSSVS